MEWLLVERRRKETTKKYEHFRKTFRDIRDGGEKFYLTNYFHFIIRKNFFFFFCERCTILLTFIRRAPLCFRPQTGRLGETSCVLFVLCRVVPHSYECSAKSITNSKTYLIEFIKFINVMIIRWAVTSLSFIQMTQW